MTNFQLLPGDKYDGRIAEIYITEKQFLIYHCSVCEEIYATFNELLSHITKDHFENIKEYNKTIDVVEEVEEEKEGKRSVAQRQENKLVIKEFIKTTQCHNLVIANTDTETTILEKEEGTQNIANNSVLIKTIKEINERENLPAFFDVSKISPQRKKFRNLTGLLKNYNICKTKLNPITRYQVHNPKEELKYVCGICGFAFKEKYNLRAHLLRHSNQKSLSCSTCTKKFFTKVEMRLHEYRHKGERPYLCNHCGMGFVSSTSLIQHNKKHYSLNHSFKCEQCEKTFANFYQLKTHQVVHREERDFISCNECSLTFKCQMTLNNHKKFHENNQKFLCKNCDLEFSTELAFKTHKRKLHNFCNIEIESFKEDNNKNNNASEWLIEEGLIFEHNFDEYELVQTLTDLECNKNI